MNFVVLASDEQWQTITENGADTQWVRAALPFAFSAYADTDAYFILTVPEKLAFEETVQPIFINSVCTTLKELQAPANVYRINGWNTFLNRPVWEITGTINDVIQNIMQQINKKFIAVADEPGLVAATVIAMIINEAYFALEDEVSTKDGIDTAMQLGTNYPYGPFVWAEKIGVANVAALLQTLSRSDMRYQPSPLLIKETM